MTTRSIRRYSGAQGMAELRAPDPGFVAATQCIDFPAIGQSKREIGDVAPEIEQLNRVASFGLSTMNLTRHVKLLMPFPGLRNDRGILAAGVR
jgi:hypothetical protein